MNSVGDPREWRPKFPDGLVPDLIHLVLEAWKRFAKPPSNAGEVRITEEFLPHLRRTRELRRLPLKIHIEVPERPPRKKAPGGRIDIYFNPYSLPEGVYFCFECKRMNIRRRKRIERNDLAYVRDGMMRFIAGKYAAALGAAGMIAYVMDGDTQAAIQAVSLRMQKEKRLCLEHPAAPLNPPQDVCSRSVLESDHRLTSKMFRIHHVFLSLS